MTKVITYGTYDLLHYGHIRLLERAKELGDYLIVGVTADDFDKKRGKINVQQSLMERIEAVKATGLADEIIVEEYEGQKIDDIRRYDVDIFTVGSDWDGQFDYLNEYCKVVYLDRTEGVSSTDLRSKELNLKLGIVGENSHIKKYYKEAKFVNGIDVVGVYTLNKEFRNDIKEVEFFNSYEELLDKVDAVYIASHPTKHYSQIKAALTKSKHVICESPLVLSQDEWKELYKLAQDNKLILVDAIKTAYITAYNRLLLLIKSGIIGNVVSVDVTCTSLKENYSETSWNSMTAWGPTALLPIFQLLGTSYKNVEITSLFSDKLKGFDLFSKINFIYDNAVASLKVGTGVKAEGELIISGTKGYAYVPAPWWKMDYFEMRFEDQNANKKYYYQLDGEGIRFLLVAFIKAVKNNKFESYISKNISKKIVEIEELFINEKNVNVLKSEV